jgi:GT2 family glycosyltransferase
MTQKKVYVLLPVHNRLAITKSFIEDLAVQTYPNIHLILIDDGSVDGTEEMVRSKIKNLTVIKGSGNWWWAGSLQRGIDWLANNVVGKDDVILMINDDVKIPAGFIETGCELLKANDLLKAAIYDDESHEIVGTGVVYLYGKTRFRQPLPGEQINCVSTNGLLIRWQDLQIIGGFYPLLLPHYLSDYEFTIRARKKGMQLRVSPELKLYSNRKTTGFREIEEKRFLPFLKKLFSKKSPDNPMYWTTFAILTGPIHYLPMHLVRIWKRTVMQMAGKFIRSSSPHK